MKPLRRIRTPTPFAGVVYNFRFDSNNLPETGTRNSRLLQNRSANDNSNPRAKYQWLSDADSDGNRNPYGYRNCNADFNPNSDGNANIYAYSHSNCYGHSDSHGNAYTHAHTDSETHAFAKNYA